MAFLSQLWPKRLIRGIFWRWEILRVNSPGPSFLGSTIQGNSGFRNPRQLGLHWLNMPLFILIHEQPSVISTIFTIEHSASTSTSDFIQPALIWVNQVHQIQCRLSGKQLSWLVINIFHLIIEHPYLYTNNPHWYSPSSLTKLCLNIQVCFYQAYLYLSGPGDAHPVSSIRCAFIQASCIGVK